MVWNRFYNPRCGVTVCLFFLLGILLAYPTKSFTFIEARAVLTFFFLNLSERHKYNAAIFKSHYIFVSTEYI